PNDYTAIVFSSRTAIDHFFRLCGELRIKMSDDTKYFCSSDTVANYLQKFIMFRKRKVFSGTKSILDLKTYILRNKEEKFFLPCSDGGNPEVTRFFCRTCEKCLTHSGGRHVPYGQHRPERTESDQIRHHRLFLRPGDQVHVRTIPGLQAGRPPNLCIWKGGAQSRNRQRHDRQYPGGHARSALHCRGAGELPENFERTRLTLPLGQDFASFTAERLPRIFNRFAVAKRIPLHSPDCIRGYSRSTALPPSLGFA
ncbi:MAG: uroporphyrinogen-III synthase, partial [Saprospirales bacterium]|nr:uroporphyrinogen-III synthase [Saprospirales bacterium]